MKTSSIDQLFDAVNLVVYNLSEHPELQKTMNGVGFNSKRVQDGNALLQGAQQFQDSQESHYNESRRLSLQISKDSDAMLDTFKEHIAIARTTFRKAPHMLQELKINRLASSQWKLTRQAIDFYGIAPQYMEQLQQYGAIPEAFEQNKAAAEALLALKARRLKTKGDAENTTQMKNQSLKELRAWYGEFRKLARIAFKDTPQALETFGIVVSATKRKKQVEAGEGSL